MTTIIPISVDCETSGSVPGLFNMLQVGACVVDDPSRSFEMLVKPICDGFDPEAMAVHGMSAEMVRREGLHAEVGMLRFTRWVEAVAADAGPDAKALFVGLGAAFDWAFVNFYFVRFMGRNPFGHAPLDLKAFYAGRTGKPWNECTSSQMDKFLGIESKATHTALGDALYQADLYRRIAALTPA